MASNSDISRILSQGTLPGKSLGLWIFLFMSSCAVLSDRDTTHSIALLEARDHSLAIARVTIGELARRRLITDWRLAAAEGAIGKLSLLARNPPDPFSAISSSPSTPVHPGW
jgi:hypothetical protein